MSRTQHSGCPHGRKRCPCCSRHQCVRAKYASQNKTWQEQRDEAMQKPTGKRVEFYKDVAGKYRWTQYASNGQIRGASEQGFHDLDAAKSNFVKGMQGAVEILSQGLTYYNDTNTGERKQIEVKG